MSLCCCLQGRTLTTAWVGDSRMVLGRQRKKGWRSTWEAIDLSTDHKPTTPEERHRILDNHGRVERWVSLARFVCVLFVAIVVLQLQCFLFRRAIRWQAQLTNSVLLARLAVYSTTYIRVLCLTCLAGWLMRPASPWGPTGCGWSTPGCQGWQ